ncbi:hypothetical protein [Microbacterium sp. K24]|uniref:hypothetical protein n=1 Tax=Microbacterium sp. K24 TaxID=2305446 RepID=UPI0014439543|nr:hypothetical protein [Microbacterium sp. K24]
MTTMEFRDGSNVTIGDAHSPELVDVAGQIKALREQSTASSNHHIRTVDAINNDPTLSDQGKKERITALETERSNERSAMIAQEKAIINNKITALERRLDGYVGYSESNIIAFRDAQDRAEAVDDADRAASLMARAIRNNDRTLAHALYRRAVEHNWTEARNAFAADNPAVAGLVRDVHKLQTLRDTPFNRAVAYM